MGKMYSLLALRTLHKLSKEVYYRLTRNCSNSIHKQTHVYWKASISTAFFKKLYQIQYTQLSSVMNTTWTSRWWELTKLSRFLAETLKINVNTKNCNYVCWATDKRVLLPQSGWHMQNK